MATELEKLRKDSEDLSKKFKDAGQGDLAALLDVDAQGFDAKAKIARARGVLTFALPSNGVNAAEISVDPQEQMLANLGYTPDQIARHHYNITENTRVYVGSLVHRDEEGKFVRIFERLGGVERIFTPEGEVKVQKLTIGGKNKAQLLQELRQGDFQVSRRAEDMINSRDFDTLKNPQTIRIVKMPVKALRFGERATPSTAQIYERADLLGLDQCRAEVGPHQRLQDTNQPTGDAYWIVMKQITDSRGAPLVFELDRDGGGSWLDGRWAGPDFQWLPEGGFVFSLRK